MLCGALESDRSRSQGSFQIHSKSCVNRSLTPWRGERFRFPSSQYARCMEARHDLGKFITELTVAERGAVLSSGRDLGSAFSGQKIAQCVGTATARQARVTGKPDHRPETDRRIDNVGRLTPGAGIETSTRMGSDQTAAEALQEAETEVGVAVKGHRRAGHRPSIDRPRRRVGVGLTA
jgi:hypothetical protein